MRRTVLVFLVVAALAAFACAPSSSGAHAPPKSNAHDAGEGEGAAGEGEGAASEGEGASSSEGEGASSGEGEGASSSEGEGEGASSSEGEGEGASSGEGEGAASGGEGEGASAGEGEGEGSVAAPVDVIVGVGYGGLRILSIDHGAHWCQSAVDDVNGGDDPRLLREVAAANGRFVSAGWDHLYTSPNGWSWTDQLAAAGTGMPTGQWVGGIKCNASTSTWVACGGFGTAMRSVDGAVTWQSVDYPGINAGRALAFGDGEFVCSDDGGWNASFDDGLTWQSIAGSGNVAFENGSFVVDDGVLHAFGVNVQYEWPNGVAVNGSVVYVPVEPLERFAALTVSSDGFALDAMPAALRSCLSGGT